MVKTKRAKKPVKPVEEEMSLKILQPEKFKMIIIIAVCFVFLMMIIIFLSNLNSVPEEPKDSGVYVEPKTNLNQTSSEDPISSIMSWELFGLPGALVIMVGFSLWKIFFSRHKLLRKVI